MSICCEIRSNFSVTYVVSFCRIKSQINRIDGQSGSKRKCEHALSAPRKKEKETHTQSEIKKEKKK